VIREATAAGVGEGGGGDDELFRGELFRDELFRNEAGEGGGLFRDGARGDALFREGGEIYGEESVGDGGLFGEVREVGGWGRRGGVSRQQTAARPDRADQVMRTLLLIYTHIHPARVHPVVFASPRVQSEPLTRGFNVPCAPKWLDFEFPILKTTKLQVETRSCT